MDKISKVWQNLKKYWIIYTCSVIFFLLLILFFPVFRSSWLYFPESLRARIAIRKLTDSQEMAIYCREDCSVKRLLYRNIILEALDDDLLISLEKAITNQDVLPEVRELMIKIWLESGYEPSQKLKSYCENPNTPFAIRAQLMEAWPELAGASYYSEIVGNFKTADDAAKKEELLKLLVGKSDATIVNFIWDLILRDYPNDLKTKGFFLLANIDNKKQVYQASDVNDLRSVLESGDYPHRVKDQAILVLADYYAIYPEACESLLIDVVNRTKYFDDYQRSFAIDILNRNRQKKISPVQLSQDDWNHYFNY